MFQVRLDYALTLGESDIRIDQGMLFRLLEAVRTTGSLSQAAKELDMSYRHMWNMVHRWEQQLGRRLIVMQRGQGAFLTPFGDRLLWAEQRVKNRLSPVIENVVSEIESALSQAMDGARPTLRICASHDLALAQLRDELNAGGELRLDLRFRGSADSLSALLKGDCDVAGFHFACNQGKGSLLHLSYRQWLKPRQQLIIPFVIREQGLMLPETLARQVGSLIDVARLQLRLINRQRGSGTRLLFDQLLHDAGVKPEELNGYDSEEFTHLAVAATVASGAANVGFGIRAAAARYGLHFVPLTTERYCFLLRRDRTHAEEIQAFIRHMQSRRVEDIVATLPGYVLAPQRESVPLRGVLPW